MVGDRGGGIVRRDGIVSDAKWAPSETPSEMPDKRCHITCRQEEDSLQSL